jgi:hypothetical protein
MIPRGLCNISLGKINFLRSFIPNFAKITKPISNIFNKDKKFKCDDHTRASFRMIKNSINMTPALVSPNYSSEFQLFSFSLEEMMGDILFPKNDYNQ